MFKALLLTQPVPRETRAECVELDEASLPAGAVRVAVSHSTLNYKDALAITGRSPVVRQFPMVPGIDLAGTVLDSEDARFQPGDAVLLNGWGVGETHWGGLAQQARVNGDWLIRRPEAFSARDAMAIGTADRKSTRLNSSHLVISYAVFCFEKKKKIYTVNLCTYTLTHHI